MFFPGVGSMGSNTNTQLTSSIQNNARELNRYRAPNQVIRIKVDGSFLKDAIAEAERPLASLPYRVKMQTIFLDTVLNGHVTACMQKRKNLTLLKKFHLCDENGVTDEAGTALLQTEWFQKMREYIADARYYGYSLITFGDLIDNAFPNVQITRRTDVSPDRECLATMPYIPSGINFNNPNYQSDNGEKPYDWSLWVTTPSENGVSTCGYGLLVKVAIYEIVLRSITGWNTDYIERFGQPIVVIKTIDNSEEERGRAEQAVSILGSSGGLILNKNDEFALEGDSNSGTGWKSYENLETRYKKFISAILLGHEDGLASSGGKMTKEDEESPQMKALVECETIDCNFEEHIINTLLIPKLIKLGIKIPIGKKYKVKNDSELHEENENKAKQAQAWANVATAMFTAGMKIDPEQLSELSGVKLTDAPQPEPTTNLSQEVKNKLRKIYA